MSKSHNKKRNLGIVYELLLKEVADSVMSDDDSRSRFIIDIIKKHFNSNSELLKEFRLINALAKTKIVNQNVIGSILNESKNAVRRINYAKLEHEKTALIHDININIGSDFFDRQLNEYKTYATIQILFNNWRNQQPDLETVAKLEQYLCEEILPFKENKEVVSETQKRMNGLDSGTKRMVLKLMSKKVKEKYDSILNEEQKSLLKDYVFEFLSGKNTDILKNKLLNLKNSTIKLIDNYQTRKKDGGLSEFVTNKLKNCKSVILTENVDNIDDNTITKFLSIIKLKQELLSED